MYSSGFNPLRNRDIVFRLLRWSKPYWKGYALLALLIALNSFIPVLWADFYRRFFNAAVDKNPGQMLAAAALLAAVLFIELAGDLLHKGYYQRVSNRILIDFRMSALARALKLKVPKFMKWSTADKLYRLDACVASAQEALTQRIPNLIADGLKLIFLIAYLTTLSVNLVAGALAIALLFPFLTNLFGKSIHQARQQVNRLQAEQDQSLQEQLQGYEIIRNLKRSRYFYDKWKTEVERTRQGQNKVYRLTTLVEFLSMFGYWAGTIYIYICGAMLVGGGKIEIGVIAAFTLVYDQIFYPISNLANQWVSVQTSLADAGRVFELVNPLEKTADARASDSGTDIETDEWVDGDIVFENVSFRYDDTAEILKQISFRIRKGTVCAIVGPSGGGKSTILKLLMGFCEPTSGSIMIGNRVMNEQTRKSWRKRVSYIAQETVLFDASVKDNVKLSKPDATDEEVIRALMKANAHEFVRELEHGMDTLIGDGGRMLSGGQAQRIALARAALRNPAYLVCDEPTSAQDVYNEDLVISQLKDPETTVVIVAHRLSTIKDADLILYVESGMIAESGTHQELMERRGAYAALYRTEESEGDASEGKQSGAHETASWDV